MSSFYYILEVPTQNVSEHFSSPEAAVLFLEAELQYFRMLHVYVTGKLSFVDANHRTVDLVEMTDHELRRIITDVQNGELGSLNNYVHDAVDMRVLIGRGSFGQRVEHFIRTKQADEGRWLLSMTCIAWLERHGDFATILAPFRAALVGSPQTGLNVDQILSASNRASEASSEAATLRGNTEFFLSEKKELFDRLEALYRQKLTLEEPAKTWADIADRKTKAWRVWLIVFSVLAAAPFAVLALFADRLGDTITKLTTSAGGTVSIAGIALVTVPALFYAWLLKNISRVFIQNLNLADDASHRRALSFAYLGLLADSKHSATDADRAIILNALFRPIPPQTNDEGPPAGLIEMVKKGGN